MPVRAAPRSSSFGSLMLFARRTTTSIFFFVLFLCSRVFFACGVAFKSALCARRHSMMMMTKRVLDGVVTSFWCFFQCPILSLDWKIIFTTTHLLHRPPPHTTGNERERERERDARNHHRGARVDFFISDVFFERPPRKFRSKMERRRRAMSSGLCRIDDAETTTTTKRTD